MKNPVVIGFDQAFKNTGWAAGTADGPVACGLISVAPRRFDSLGARFVRFERGVRDVLSKHKPALVIFEEHRAHAGLQAAQVLGACAALIMKVCDEMGVEYMAVPVPTLKKHATGTPRASKELMVAVARKKFPTMTIADDNVADAIHMMQWGIDQLK